MTTTGMQYIVRYSLLDILTLVTHKSTNNQFDRKYIKILYDVLPLQRHFVNCIQNTNV